MNNKDKIILDLCAGTGSWSKPYKEAGYDVRVITLPDKDVLTYKPPKNVYGILAAPPCTMFSFCRTRAKKPRDFKEGMECVRACLNIIWTVMEISQNTALKKNQSGLKFWALENPLHGFLKDFLGKPSFIFNPYDFGDGYPKRTALWGNFNDPIKKPIQMTKEVKESLKGNKVMNTIKFDYLKSKDIHPEVFGKLTKQERRAITPAGFAKAFFEANK